MSGEVEFRAVAKFLVGRDGQVVKRYAPTTKPEQIAADIEAALTA